MKKLLSLTLILVMLLCALSACNVRSNDSDTDTNTEIDTNSEIVTETDTSKDENSDKDTDISSDSSIDPVVNATTWKFNYDYGFYFMAKGDTPITSEGDASNQEDFNTCHPKLWLFYTAIFCMLI